MCAGYRWRSRPDQVGEPSAGANDRAWGVDLRGIERVGAGYLLGVGPGEFDLHEFEETVAAARGEEPESAAQLPRSALGMWRGPALGGPTEALIDAEAPGLEERRLCVLEDSFDAELTTQRPARILGELRHGAADHPFRDRLQGQLMLALNPCQRRSETLQY